MGRYTMMLFCLLFLSAKVSGQDTVLVELASEKQLTNDEKINRRIEPVSKLVESFVFYAIPIKKDLVFKRVEGDQASIVEDAPYALSYSGTPPVDQPFTLTYINDQQFEIAYSFIDEEGNTYRVQQIGRFGEPLKIGPTTYTITEHATSRITRDYRFELEEISIPIVLIWLILGAIVFTIYFRFVNVRKFRLAVDIVRGKYSDPEESGEVSHFQALTAALSATVGLGNIAGVAIGISLGGPGATFWMIVAGLLGMSSKFVECTLGVRFRKIDERGVVLGGPMYYLSEGLKLKGMAGFGKVLAVLFSIMCIGGSFGGGNMFQVNQAFQQFSNVIPAAGPLNQGWVFGVMMSILVALVIIGGIKSIARVTEKIVPIMVGVYVLAALIIIFGHASEVPHSFGLIFSGAFAPQAIAGGFVGVLIQGFRRAAFSNEAGIGSASIAHAAVKTNNPVSEGLVSLLEPFIDTVVVCTMTALVIIITGNYLNAEAADGIALTSAAFSDVITWFPYVLALAVMLFAFSTMISWSYYGLQSWKFLFGNTRTADISYKVVFCAFVIIGAAMDLDPVIGFSDAMIFAMSFPNVLGMIFLLPYVKEELNNYLTKIRTGAIIKR